jgi:hypothetical protein
MVAVRSYLGGALDTQQVARPSTDRKRDWYEEGLGAGRREMAPSGGSRPVIPIVRLRALIAEWEAPGDGSENREYISCYVAGLKAAMVEAEREE